MTGLGAQLRERGLVIGQPPRSQDHSPTPWQNRGPQRRPDSLRSEAARRGVTLHQVRKERALLAAGRVVCPECNGIGSVAKPTAQGVRAPGGGEALPIQGQSEGTP